MTRKLGNCKECIKVAKDIMYKFVFSIKYTKYNANGKTHYFNFIFFSFFFNSNRNQRYKLTEHRKNLRKVSSSLTLSTLPLPTARKNSQCASNDIEDTFENSLSKKWKHY